MSETTATPSVVVSKRGQEIIKADVNRAIKSRLNYAEYVACENVTLETVPEHVAVFRGAYRVAAEKAAEKAERDLVIAREQGGDVEAATIARDLAVSHASGTAIKAYATKIREGLKHWCVKVEAEQDETVEEAETVEETDETGKAETPDYLANIANAVTVALAAGVDVASIMGTVETLLTAPALTHAA